MKKAKYCMTAGCRCGDRAEREWCAGALSVGFREGKSSCPNSYFLMLERRRSCAVLPADNRFAQLKEMDFPPLR